MNKVQAVVVANSHKNHGRCLAVINLQTSELMRPVFNIENRAVPEQFTIVRDGHIFRTVRPGDFVLLTVSEIDSSYWQRENWFVDSDQALQLLSEENFEFLRARARACTKEQYLQNDYLLNDTSSSIISAERQNPSLEVRLVESLKIYSRKRVDGTTGLRAAFRYKDQVFDFAYTGDPKPNGFTADKAMVCVSLGELFNGKHYKLIAGLLPVT